MNQNEQLLIEWMIGIVISIVKWFCKYIPKIKYDLAVLLVIVVAAAFANYVVVFIRAVVQAKLHKMRFHHEQHAVMREFYPLFQTHMLRLKLAVCEIEYGIVYTNLKSAVRKYLEFEKDPEEYLLNHENEIENIESFCAVMADFMDRLAELNVFLSTSVLPKPPLHHPLLRRKIHKMLAFLQHYAHLWDKYRAQEISPDVMQKKMSDLLEYWKIDFNYAKMEEYLCLLDIWFGKFL